MFTGVEKKQQQAQTNNKNKKHQRVDNTYNLANLHIKLEIETTEPKKYTKWIINAIYAFKAARLIIRPISN